MRLRTQFLLAACLVLVLLEVVILVFVIPKWQAELEEGARQRGRAVVRMLAHNCAEPAMVGNYSELQRVVDDLARDPGVVFVAVLDRKGRVRVSSRDPEGHPFFELDAPPPDPAGILTPDAVEVQNARTSMGGFAVLDFAAPLAVYKRSWGLARLGLSLEPIERATRAVTTRMLALGLAGLIVAVILVALLAMSITRPLARLAGAARRLSDRHLEARVDVSGARELVQLGAAFNKMAESIQQHVSEIQQKSSELEAGYRVLAWLSTTIDREALMEGVLEVIVEVLFAERCELMALDPRRDVIDHFSHGPGGFAFWSMKAEDLGVEQLDRVADLAGLARDHLQPGERDLFVPLAVEDLNMGGMMVRPAAGREFGERERQLAEGISNHLLVALENARLYDLAIRDGLTGLTIRRYFTARLKEELDRARRYLRPLCLLMIDIDHFKRVNDTRGHPTGDHVLREMAQRLKDALRSTDLLSRYGGEEMVILLPDQSPQQGLLVAEKLRQAVADRPFGPEGGEPLTVTISIGVTAFPDHAQQAEELIDQADKAMYAAKQGGRNRVCMAE